MKPLLPLCLLFASSVPAQAFDHQHQMWTAVLKKYLKVSGPVSTLNYKALKKNKDAGYAKYLAALSGVTRVEYDKFSRDQKFAFLVNAYNALNVKIVVDKYPVGSIKDTVGFLRSPWKQEFFSLLGEKRHLDWILHDVLRKNWKDSRLHFAVNCASIGCPALASQAFTAGKLEQQLEAASRLFLSDRSRNRFDAKGEKLYLSKIFSGGFWYKKDFEKDVGSVEKFVAPRITDDPAQQKKILSGEVSIEYTYYNWDLNEHK